VESEEIGKEGAPAAPSGGGKRIRAGIALLIFFGVIFTSILWWWIHGINRITTDNAFIEAHLYSVSAKVAGRIEKVAVKDNQFVRKGDLLFEINPTDFKVKVDEAAAALDMTLNESSGDFAKVEQSRAELQQSHARLLQAESDLRRGSALFAKEVIPREQLERVETAVKIAAAQVAEKEENLKKSRAEAGMTGSGNREAKSAQRKAQLEEARLHAGYTKVIAPSDGYVTRKSIEPGNYIQTGQPAMVLVALADSWVTANFKESQLATVIPGQRVEFTVDAYPSHKFTGRVESIMAGTGAAFSLLPPENATGNYVKVVQRIPVRIAIDHQSDPDHLLRAGMSVVPTIFTDRTVKEAIHNMNLFR
jgi:membrane fusion protein (multidrug efflux system)